MTSNPPATALTRATPKAYPQVPCAACGKLRAWRQPSQPPRDLCVWCRGQVRAKPVEERFWSKVDKDGPIPAHNPELGPCWVWTGAVNESGYGNFLLNGRRGSLSRAHRVAFLLAEGRWPDPCALHHCDNPPCVRRTHLYEGTRAQNVKDMHDRGRYVLGRRYSGEQNGFAKLTNAQRAEIQALRNAGVTFQSIGERFGVTKQCIMSAVKRGLP